MDKTPDSFWTRTPFRAYVKENIDTKLGWITGILVTAAISMILGYFIQKDDVISAVIALIFVSLLGGFIIIGGYYSDLFRKLNEHTKTLDHSISYYRHLLCDDGHVADDIIIKTQGKRITFDKTSLKKSGNCKVECFWTAKNNMEEEYNKFHFWIQSDKSVQSFSDYHFYLDDDIGETPLDRNKCEFKYIENHEKDDPVKGQSKIKNVENTMHLPVQIGPNTERRFKLSYRSNAYEAGFEGKIDSTSYKITRVIEKFKIQIILDDEFKKFYKISQVTQPRPESLAKYFIEITDDSDVRMINSEKDLKNLPTFFNDCLEWEVYNPKIGYTYTVYFTLKKI